MIPRHGIQVQSLIRMTLTNLICVSLQTELSVIYDSVHLIAQGVKELKNSLVPSSISCIDDGTWRNGSTFMNFLKTVSETKFNDAFLQKKQVFVAGQF